MGARERRHDAAKAGQGISWVTLPWIRLQRHTNLKTILAAGRRTPKLTQMPVIHNPPVIYANPY